MNRNRRQIDLVSLNGPLGTREVERPNRTSFGHK